MLIASRNVNHRSIVNLYCACAASHRRLKPPEKESTASWRSYRQDLIRPVSLHARVHNFHRWQLRIMRRINVDARVRRNLANDYCCLSWRNETQETKENRAKKGEEKKKIIKMRECIQRYCVVILDSGLDDNSSPCFGNLDTKTSLITAESRQHVLLTTRRLMTTLNLLET